MPKIALIDPGRFDWSRSSPNIGDQIISRASHRELKRIYNDSCELTSIPSHTQLDEKAYKILDKSDKVVVGGSNLFWFRLFPRASWPLRLRDVFKLRNVCFMGVGWGSYKISTGPFGRFVCGSILNPTGHNSFRDKYSCKKALELGVPNPIFTGCHTTWAIGRNATAFTQKKKKQCVFTLTDYAKDPHTDRMFIALLKKMYGQRNLFFWPQGSGDLSYLEQLEIIQPYQVLKGDLPTFENFLRSTDVDYVGTRLHGGIFAMEHNKRSVIVSVDNRAVEMGQDLGLAVVSRDRLDVLAEVLEGDTHYELTIPHANIDLWGSNLKS
jgi:polysaccharide pyruvyl transferase WcaK-like protein